MSNPAPTATSTFYLKRTTTSSKMLLSCVFLGDRSMDSQMYFALIEFARKFLRSLLSFISTVALYDVAGEGLKKAALRAIQDLDKRRGESQKTPNNNEESLDPTDNNENPDTNQNSGDNGDNGSSDPRPPEDNGNNGNNPGPPEDNLVEQATTPIFLTRRQDPVILSVVYDLRIRAGQADMFAKFCLLAILFTVGGGIGLIIYLQNSSNKTLKGTTPSKALQKGFAKEVNNVEEKIENVAKENKTKSSVAMISSQTKVLSKKLELLQEKSKWLKRLSDAESKQDNESLTKILMRSAPQVTITVMLIWLVKILSEVFAFNTKLAQHCISRANALQLVSNDDTVFLNQLSDFLSAKDIHFKPAKTTPIDQGVDSLTKLLESVTKASKDLKN